MATSFFNFLCLDKNNKPKYLYHNTYVKYDMQNKIIAVIEPSNIFFHKSLIQL